MEAIVLFLISHPALMVTLVGTLILLIPCTPEVVRYWKRNSWTYYRMAFERYGEVYYLRRNRLDHWEVRPADCKVWCNANDGSVEYSDVCRRTHTYVYTPKNRCVRGLTGVIISTLVHGWDVLAQAEAVPCSKELASSVIWREPAYII